VVKDDQFAIHDVFYDDANDVAGYQRIRCFLMARRLKNYATPSLGTAKPPTNHRCCSPILRVTIATAPDSGSWLGEAFTL